MATRKIIGIVFSVIAILFSIIFLIQSDLNINLKEYFDYSFKSYFSLSYFNQILPLILCFILLYGGVLLIIKPIKSNPVLALFGFTVLEEIVFSWFGLISIDFPIYIVVIFFSIALLALWIAYSDTINQKHLSLKEGVSSLIMGTLINALSYYL
ncbi:hypothetical protein [Winogradskyella sp. PG-2]|uniref:hypothetical protein n=1 Tax=Winogradskyella sp. PG-2 TaxID=754409 RepID=UPI0004586EB8|nr:hypothetical protein [Winogradskyella sp. PG-2]BAO76551.1 hypothetical protein WPG_2321 [Winogradskyella sp. PG-2]